MSTHGVIKGLTNCCNDVFNSHASHQFHNFSSAAWIFHPHCYFVSSDIINNMLTTSLSWDHQRNQMCYGVIDQSCCISLRIILTMHCVFLHQHMVTKQFIQMSSNMKAVSPKLDIIATFKTIISILSIKSTRLFLSPLCLSIKAKDTLDTFIIHHRVYPRTIVVVFIQCNWKNDNFHHCCDHVDPRITFSMCLMLQHSPGFWNTVNILSILI